VPFVAPAGIRWVRVDRATGKPVFGVFPTTEDPKSEVIWEAFQPQTEPRRSIHGSMGDPYQRQQALAPKPQPAQPQAAQSPPGPSVRTAPPPIQSAPQPQTPSLPTQNGVQ
jgi:penicillin-binding protein 1A